MGSDGMVQVVNSEDNLANSEVMSSENLRASKNTQWFNLEYVDIETISVEGGSKRTVRIIEQRENKKKAQQESNIPKEWAHSNDALNILVGQNSERA